MPDWLALTRALAPIRGRWHRMEADLDQKCGRKEEYTVLEAAAFWNKSEETVRRWIRAGKIKTTNRGQRKTRISRQLMLDKQWELSGESAFFSKLYSGLPERHQDNIAGG
jgi:excisionase family DNA binding protein